ncbi:MAG: DinB family protein [Gemmatimonadetes bacterium]|nr:DinB family protein [Gemmatimonadota bacterium]
MSTSASASQVVITPQQFLAHWQAHRRLTRRVIDAFPADKLFTHSIGGMRTFGEIAKELLGMATPTVAGILTDQWGKYEEAAASTKAEVLTQWDAITAELDAKFLEIPVERFQETKTAFGQWTMPVHDLLLYVIDNEIHHRGQGYVYLRSLGIEPPAFYDRS